MDTTLRPGTLDERPEPVKAPRVETRSANDNAPSKPNDSHSLVALSRELARGSGWERDPRTSAKDASASALGWVERYIYEIVRAAVREELSLAVASPAAKPAAPTEYLTITRAAEVADVHACTIRDWIKNGSLKAYRCGGRGYRILRSDLDAALTVETTNPTTQEISEQVDALFTKRRHKRRAG
jgi:excisionase family DNA binding protein